MEPKVDYRSQAEARTNATAEDSDTHPKAAQLFELERRHIAVSAKMEQMVREALGFRYEDGVDVGFDHYDGSAELYRAPKGWQITDEQAASIWALGFARFYARDTDDVSVAALAAPRKLDTPLDVAFDDFDVADTVRMLKGAHAQPQPPPDRIDFGGVLVATPPALCERVPTPPTMCERVADLVESVRQFKDFVTHGPGRREPDMTKFSSGSEPHPDRISVEARKRVLEIVSEGLPDQHCGCKECQEGAAATRQEVAALLNLEGA